jgi:flagellar motor switch protein FliG
MDLVKDIDGELGQRIQELMFVFDNLIDVADTGIQALLREISSDNLIIALKGADQAVRDKIFRNMSKRAAEMLRDDLEAKGPVRLSEVEIAQKEILAVARRMAEAGDIALGGKGGDEFV